MKDNEKAFYLFYDWIDDLDSLEGADAWRIVKAIAEYHRNGTNPLDGLDGMLKVVVSIMYRQIKRGEEISELRRQAVNTRYNKPENFVVQKSTKSNFDDFVVHERTTDNSIQNTDNSILISSPSPSSAYAHTHTCEEEQKLEESSEDYFWIPKEEREKLIAQLKRQEREATKLKYLGGPDGQGVVFMSDKQFDMLCEELSIEELERYMGIIADCELKGKHYAKSHYQAICDMVAQDRKTGGLKNGKH